MLEALLEYVVAEDRICPAPSRWRELYEILPDTHRVGLGWKPPLSLSLAAWWTTQISLKIDRLVVRIMYASEHGVLDQVDHFLRSLPESDWAHVKDFSTQ